MALSVLVTVIVYSSFVNAQRTDTTASNSPYSPGSYASYPSSTYPYTPAYPAYPGQPAYPQQPAYPYQPGYGYGYPYGSYGEREGGYWSGGE